MAADDAEPDQAGAARMWLAAIVDSSYDAIVGKDLSGTITSWNGAAETMFGYDAAEIIGRPIFTIIPPDRIDEERDVLDRVRRGERLVHFETVRQRKDGSRIPVSLTVSPIRGPGGQIIGISKIARDLAEAQAQEQRIQELQAELIHVNRLNELGQMVSALAHEVSQPLTAVRTYLTAMRRLLAAQSYQIVPEIIEKMSQQAERAGLIIQRLRDLVRKRETEKQVEDLAAMIEETAALVLIGAPPELRLDTRIDAAAAAAVIDRVQIQQVLLNLMRNAAEAMAASPRREILVSTAPAGDMVEISVADSGPGLPPSIRANLFKPFHTTKPNGMGVGLSVCRSIVEAHGGSLWADPEAGCGTVFRFTVPRPALHSCAI